MSGVVFYHRHIKFGNVEHPGYILFSFLPTYIHASFSLVDKQLCAQQLGGILLVGGHDRWIYYYAYIDWEPLLIIYN